MQVVDMHVVVGPELEVEDVVGFDDVDPDLNPVGYLEWLQQQEFQGRIKLRRDANGLLVLDDEDLPIFTITKVGALIYNAPKVV